MLVMLVICVTNLPYSNLSLKWATGNWYVSINEKSKLLSLSLSHSIFPMSLYTYLPSLCLVPRPAICTPHVSSAIAITFLVQYFNDGKLHWALPRLPFHSSRFPVPNSQFPVTSARNDATFSRATTKFNFDYAWESPLLRFLCHKLFSNLPSFPELMTQL